MSLYFPLRIEQPAKRLGPGFEVERKARQYPDKFAAKCSREVPPMPWRISYQHPLRPDDGGIRFVPDQSEAAAEKLRLELRGYAVSEPTQAAALRLIAQTNDC